MPCSNPAALRPLGRSKISEYARSKTGMVTRPFNHPITLLQSLFPGAFPDTLPEQETRQEKLPGALLTTDEAANYLAIGAETLRRLCRWKEISFVKIGGDYRFKPLDLETWITANRQEWKPGLAPGQKMSREQALELLK
jgi:excisionase family DNA binding protein